MKELLRKKEWLAVCIELLAYYRNELPAKVDYELQRQCPFCTLASEILGEWLLAEKLVKRTAGGACKFCVWHYFEDETCSEFGEREFPDVYSNLNIESLRRYRNIEWVQMRIPMLEKWIAELQGELK